MVETELIKCKNCKKKFERAIKPVGKGYFAENIKNCRSINCSQRCSKDNQYNRTHKTTIMINGIIKKR